MLDGVDGEVEADDGAEPDGTGTELAGAELAGAELLGAGAGAVAVSLPLNGQVVVYSVTIPLEVTVTTVVP